MNKEKFYIIVTTKERIDAANRSLRKIFPVDGVEISEEEVKEMIRKLDKWSDELYNKIKDEV